MILGSLDEDHQNEYISEMKNRWNLLSLKSREDIEDVAFNFIEDRYFLNGQGIEFESDKNGRFDETTQNLVLSYAVDLETSPLKTFLYKLLEDQVA